MSKQRYPEEFKTEAVKQITERGHKVASRIDTGLVLNALVMALWRRQPKQAVTVHSDQGCQFTSHEWQAFLRENNLISSMSRRGNCHDNAVAESFFQLLKRERIRRQIYSTRNDPKADVFNYIEMFYNAKRRHSTAAGLSPVEFEQRHRSQRLTSVYGIRGDSDHMQSHFEHLSHRGLR